MCHTCPPASPSPCTRRQAVRTLLAAGAAAGGITLGAPRAFAQAPHAGPATPQDALQLLMEGNARFARGEVMAPNRNMARLQDVASAQRPFAAFLGCSDSRVPIEIVFDQGFGDLFVVRDAGNITTSEAMGSLEFGTLVLGAKVLFVLGHSGCGAVAATLKGDPVPGQISALFSHIQPAVDAAGGDLDTAIVNNVRLQAGLLRRASPVIRTLVDEQRLMIAGGVYDLRTGRVSPVDLAPLSPPPSGR